MKEHHESEVYVDPFLVARMLLDANRIDLPESDLNYVLGSIRSRSHKNLSDVYRGQGPDKRGISEVRLLAQIQALFKKNEGFGDEKSRNERTIEDFHKWESWCRITNRRLDFQKLYPERNTFREGQLESMRRVIAAVMGDFRSYLDSVPERVRLTNGASADTPKMYAQAPRKLCQRSPQCYAGSIPAFEALVRYYGGGCFYPDATNFNRLSLVPKQWDKKRTIAAEAEASLPFQLTVDSYVKERLELVGIDLRSQVRNQRLAKEGSVTGKIATLDLSAASDTVSMSVVDLLFPMEWVEWLKMHRAPFWRFVHNDRESTGVYAKFSTMGNGYTFVLETLIFYAVCVTCGSSVASVFGDDICVSTEVYDDVVSLLRYLGFVPNDKKSFREGSFRESCGCDYYNGVDVRPFFLRKTQLDRKELCTFVNGMAHWSLGNAELTRYLADLVDRHELPLVPEGADSSCGVFTTSAWDKRLNSQACAFWDQTQEFACLQYRTRKLRSHLRDYWYRLFEERTPRSMPCRGSLEYRRSYTWPHPSQSDRSGDRASVTRDIALFCMEGLEEREGLAQTTKRIRRRWAPLKTSGSSSLHLSVWTSALLEQLRRMRTRRG